MWKAKICIQPIARLPGQGLLAGRYSHSCCMIRHLEGNPRLQTDRCEDERYIWLHEAEV